VAGETGDAERFWLVAGPLAVLGTLGCGAIVAASLVSGRPPLPSIVVVPTQVTALPIGVMGVATILALTTQRRLLTVLAASAPSILPVTGVLIVVFWGCFAFGGHGLPDEAEARDGHFYGRFRTTEVEITRDEYLDTQSFERRQNAALCGLLYVPGVSLCLHAWYRRRHPDLGLDPDDTGHRRPRRRHPRRDKARRHSRRKRDRSHHG